MRITPLDVRKQEFDRVLRGLDPDEVHAFLATVADEYEAVLTDNKQLREKVIELDQKVAEYRNMERTLRDTLLTAERVMNDARQNARKEAENILREAEVKAREATADIQNQVDALRGQMRELRGQRDGFMARLQSLAEAQIGLTESYRKDFREDDDRTERLMRDPGPTVVRPPVDEVIEVPPEATPEPMPAPEPTRDTAPDDPTPTTPPSPDDAWRRYDLEVGDTVSPPPPDPVDTRLPETSTPEPARDDDPPAPRAQAPVDEPAPPAAAPAPVEHEEVADLDRTLDEVTSAVDSALDDSGAVTPVQVPPHAAAEAAGQTADTLPTPDLPDPTGEHEVESRGDEDSGRWSLSRFTKGLSGF